MPLSDLQIAILKAKASGAVESKLAIAEYLTIYWDETDPGENRHYGISAYGETAKFASIGLDVHPWLLGNPFSNMEINPDLQTETISLTFDAVDGDLKARFKDFGSGVRCEIFQYFPDVNEHQSIWFGQVQAPQLYGWKQITTIATNGFRSRGLKLPKRMRPRECGFTFGGLLTAEALETNGCPYNRHIGGTVGNLNSGSPFTACPRDETGCTARFGHLRYFGGFKPDAAAVVTDQNSGYLANSKGNASAIQNPIRAIYGTKTVRGNQQLFGRREVNANTPEHGFVAGVFEVCEGPIRAIRNLKVNEKVIEAIHWNWRQGNKGQGALTQYAPDLSNFSSTAHFFARYGWVDALAADPMQMQTECTVEGMVNVPVYQNSAPGYGLIGEYFSDEAFTDEAGTRVDTTINFPTSSNPPIGGIDPNAGFSVRWTGKITFPSTANVTFTCYHDDEVVLTINGSTIINQSAYGTHTGNFSATAAVEYDIEIEFVQNANTGSNPWAIVLQWAWSGHPIEIVPSTAFSQTGTTGFVRQFSNDRLFVLLDLMNNAKFGSANPLSRFNTDNWVEVATWGRQGVRFSFTNADGETRNYDHVRTQFDGIVEGRPVYEVIADLCRSGRISLPFQHEGKYEIAAFRAFTQAEIDAAPVFYDSGEDQNLFWANGRPALELSITPNDQIINEYKVVFEDGVHGDNARPITVDNPDQKLLAGRQLGEDSLMDVPKEMAAFGVRNLNEAIKLAYGWLRFGEFDEGGSENNGKIQISCPTVHALGVKKHQLIRVVSRLISDPDAPKLPNGDDMEYFRVDKIVKVDRDNVSIVGQVYNHQAAIAFETIQTINAPPDGDPPDWPPIDPPLPNPDPLPPDIPIPMLAPTTIESINYNAATGMLEIEVS